MTKSAKTLMGEYKEQIAEAYRHKNHTLLVTYVRKIHKAIERDKEIYEDNEDRVRVLRQLDERLRSMVVELECEMADKRKADESIVVDVGGVVQGSIGEESARGQRDVKNIPVTFEGSNDKYVDSFNAPHESNVQFVTSEDAPNNYIPQNTKNENLIDLSDPYAALLNQAKSQEPKVLTKQDLIQQLRDFKQAIEG